MSAKHCLGCPGYVITHRFATGEVLGDGPCPGLPLTGSWPCDDLRRAFVAGAAWWEFASRGWTMWPADRDKAESEAEQRYPGGVAAPPPVPEPTREGETR